MLSAAPAQAHISSQPRLPRSSPMAAQQQRQIAEAAQRVATEAHGAEGAAGAAHDLESQQNTSAPGGGRFLQRTLQ